MTWAKATGYAWLEHDITPGTFPNDFWGQVDVWIPPNTFTACDDGDLFGLTACFLAFGNDLIRAQDTGGAAWKWLTDYGAIASSGPSPSTTYTIKFHYVYSGGTFATVDWYVDGVLVATDTTVSHLSQHVLYLNRFSEGCCCEIYYYSDVRLGTTNGGTEIFADDFSGGLGNWTLQYSPGAASIVTATAPSAASCPTVTTSPSSGQPGDTFTLSGNGFAPDSSLTFVWQGFPIESFMSDGSGSFTINVVVPAGFGPGEFDNLFVYDADGNLGCGGSFTICGARPSDGITTAPPTPVIALGGVSNNDNEILDYIFHAGSHWVLWQDTSVLNTSDNPVQLQTFPPPANHTLNATCISADGGSVVDYPIDTDYNFDFAQPPNALTFQGQTSDPDCGVVKTDWSRIFWFAQWSKPVLDAKFASDGATLWVAVLTREMVPYPYLSYNPFFDIPVETGGYTSFIADRPSAAGVLAYNPRFRRSIGTISFCHTSAYPVSDGGYANTGNWDPPVIRMFAGGAGGFAAIGRMEAKYCPGRHNAPESVCLASVSQQAPQGSFFSGIDIAASPNEPGVCHLVWSEGGDWGTYGLATVGGGGCNVPYIWDGGPPNRDYRVGYSTWGPTAKLDEVDLFGSHIDRQNFFFNYG